MRVECERSCGPGSSRSSVLETAASPRDAARLRGVLRVLREWVLARSAPSSPLARACALHLLCRDAGFLHDAGMVLLAGLDACLVLLLVAMRVCVRAMRADIGVFHWYLPVTRSCACI